MTLASSWAAAQTTNYFSSTGGALSGSVWSTNPAGPYTSAFDATGGGYAVFQNATTLSGGSITFAGITVAANITLGTASGTISNFGNGVIAIDVASGVTADFGSQSWTTSGTAGYIKNGDGVLALTGNTFAGGFTMNAGTVIARGVNAMGDGGGLTINGGTLAANATRDLSNKFDLGIVVNGNFTLGAGTGLAVASSNLTFNNNVSLAGGTRTITLGGTGLYTFSGAVTNGGLIVQSSGDGTAGTLYLSNTAGTSTYAGNTVIRSGILRAESNGATITATSSLGSGTVYVGDSSVTLTGSTAKLTYTSGASKFINNAIVTQGATTNIIGSAHTANTLTYTGGITMNSALTLINESNGGLVFSTNNITANAYQLNLTSLGTGALSINSTVTGSGPMVVSVSNSASTISLNAVNNGFSGAVTVQKGVLSMGNDYALGTGEVTMADGTQLNLSNSSGNGRYYGMAKIIAPGTVTLNSTTTTGRLTYVAPVDLGNAGVGGTLNIASSGNAGQTVATGLIRIFGDSTFFVGTSPAGTVQVFDPHAGITSVGGDYGITKTGSGTMIMGYTSATTSVVPLLSGAASTYGGGTTLAAGNIRLGIDNALPTGTAVSMAAGTQLDMSGSMAFPNVDVNVNLSIGGLNDYSGGTGVVFGNSNVQANTSNKGLTLTGSGNYAFSGGILNKLGTNLTPNNTLTLVKAGSGTQTLTGAGAWTAGTNLVAGVLAVGAGADAQVQDLTPLGLTTGPSGLTANGSLTVTISSAADKGITSGMAAVGSSLRAGTTVASVAGDVVTLSQTLSNSITTAGLITFGELNRATVASTTGLAVGQGISVSAGYATGTIITGIIGNTLVLSAGNTNTTTANVSGTFNAWSSLPTAGRVTFSGGGLKWAGVNSTDYSDRFATVAAQQFKLDTGGNSVTLATALVSAGGSLAKLGAGVLTLAADNTYDGPTSIAGGTLRLGTNERINNASAFHFAGGTLDTGGNEETLGALNLTADSTLDLGSGASIVAFSAVDTFDTAKVLSVLNWDGDEAGGGTDQIYIGETTILSQLQLAAIQFVNPAGNPGTYGAAQLETGEIVAAVPEPASLGLITLAGTALLRRRRRSR